MEKLDPKISGWVEDHLIPRLAEVFQERLPHRGSVEYKVTKPRGSFFLSDLFFASLRFPGSRERKILVKLPCQNSAYFASMGYDKLFDNEILFYETLAAKADRGEYPEYYLGGPDSIMGRFLVLEDVTTRGYFVSRIKTSIPLEYAIAGLKSIGRLHGNSYALKERDPEYFDEIKNRVLKIRYTDTPNESHRTTMNERIPRVTRTLRVRGYDPKFTEKIGKLFEDCVPRIIMKRVEPVEPLATIIHGDCTINNTLFRIGKDEALEAMLIDFAMLMYSSPAIDTSTFIYLSCSRDEIKHRTRDLFKAYHDALAEYMRDQKSWDPVKYSYDALWRDYEQNAIVGYLIAAYFLAMMVEYEKDNDILSLDQETIDKINTEGGGEALSNTLVDMLIDMRQSGMLDSVCT